MKAKVLLAFVALSYSPLIVVGNEATCPKEKVAAFVVEKLRGASRFENLLHVP